jgi:cyclic pyranopterin phosphate synthase
MRPTLIDPFLRKIEYLRVSVTDRCDLRCNYCLPKHWDEFNEPDDWLTFAEIERVVAAFVQLGVSRVRLTGGEPLARRELPVLAQQLGRLPNLEDLSLSTNGVQLARHAAALHQAGVTRLNVSLDSLRADRFAEITGGGKLSKVLKGLEVASAAGFAPIKINTVAMRGVNDDEFEDMVQFCTEHGYALRLIETMPVGDTGRAASDTYLDLQGVRESLQKTFELVPAAMPGGGPARYYQVAGTETRVGFITPMSQHFCDTCNRVRLSADGTLYLCLGQEDSVALRPLLRAGISDEALRTTIEDAIARKPERHEFKQKPEKIIRFMSLTGG